MDFEKFEWAEFKDDVYEQLTDTYADTQGALWWLKNELYPYSVDVERNYDAHIFDDLRNERDIPKYTETFRQDALT